MKKSIFSGKLYNEMLKQQRMWALIFVSICLVASLITIVVQYSSWQTMKETQPAQYATYAPFEDVLSVSPILTTFMYLGGLILPFGAFAFLNKRSSSDFFHSIPHTRTCVFVSTILATMTWVAITIFSNLALTVLGCIITGMTFYYSFLIPLIITLLLGTFMMCSIATLAMTITGTRFSNLILFGLILFLPRFIMALSTAGIMSLAKIVPASELGLLDAAYNIPVGMFLSGLGFHLTGVLSKTSSEIVYSYSSWIYTVVVTLAYFGVSLYAYNVRKSETAGSSALSKFMQTVYRVAIALPAMIVVGLLAILDEGNTEVYLVLVTISLFAYFLFELITTKSGKKMLKSAPMFLAVVLIAALITGGMYATAKAKGNVTVDIGDVKSVSLNQMYRGGFYEIGYGEYKASTVAFEDERIIELSANALNNTIKEFKKNEDFYAIGPAYERVDIKFHLKNGGTLTRTVYFLQNDYNEFSNLIAKNEKYIEALFSMPKDSEIDNLYLSYGAFSVQQVNALWDIYKQELDSLSDAQALSLREANSELSFRVIGRVDVTTRFTNAYYFTRDLTPKTFNEFIKLSGQSKTLEGLLGQVDKAIKTAKDSVVENTDLEYGYMRMVISLYKAMPEIFPSAENATITGEFSIDTYMKEYMKEAPSEKFNTDMEWLDELRDLIATAKIAESGESDYLVYINLTSNEQRMGDNNDGKNEFIQEDAFLEFSKENYEKLFTLLNEHTYLYEQYGYVD